MIDALNQIIEDGYNRGLVHNYTTQSGSKDKSLISISEESDLINFGSCSYLNLENEESLKEGVINAVKDFGTQFSSSRTYLSIGLYKELELLLGKIFHQPLIVTPSTTLGHLAALPVIVEPNDAVILDLQVHASIQMTVQQLKAKKISVHLIQHNCMESLEAKILHLSGKHDKVWYFADGVYSMYGDYAPFNELTDLLNKYDKFHLYIDDAHGMGWAGDNGGGVVRKHMGHHKKMVLAISLNKSYAAAGGCIVFPNEKMQRLVRNCGSTYIFSGPIQPPMLGAGIASAKLHLSDKFKERQIMLGDLIRFTNNLLDEFGLPQFQKTDSPLFFIPVGLPKVCYDIVMRMKEKGFFLNTASFPAVPMKRSGIRFMVNNSLSKNQIHAMLTCLEETYRDVVLVGEDSCFAISNNFKIPEFQLKSLKSVSGNTNKSTRPVVKVYDTIKDIDPKVWNKTFSEEGTLNYENIELVEDIFSGSIISSDCWKFFYVQVLDGNTVMLQSIITVALTKDDMLSPEHISEEVENKRKELGDDYLTTKTLITGTLVTKGNHLFIDYENANWRNGLEVFMETLNSISDEYDCGKVLIRDFSGEPNSELTKLMLELGFIKFQLPNNLLIDDLSWKDEDDHLKRLNQKYRYSVRKEILKHQDEFKLLFGIESDDILQAAYKLYENVHSKSLKLNVHKLPIDYFRKMCESDSYDVIRLYAQPGSGDKKLAGVMFSHINEDDYNALIVGLDYDYVYSLNSYKQILYQTLIRAKQLGKKRLDLAFTAELEKKKIGARPNSVFGFLQLSSHFNAAVLDTIGS